VTQADIDEFGFDFELNVFASRGGADATIRNAVIKFNRRGPRFEKACYGSTFTSASRPTAIGSNLEIRCNNWERQKVKSPSRDLPEPEAEPEAAPDPSRT